MSKSVAVDIFAEDYPQEKFLKPLVTRIAREEGVPVSVRVRSARGGHARAIREFELYQNFVERSAARRDLPDLVIVAIDTNCMPFSRKRDEIRAVAREAFRHRLVAACPDPHIERWYLADLDSFQTVVGVRPKVGSGKCRREEYRRILSQAIQDAGHPPMLGGIEFAHEIVAEMDFFRAGKSDASLKHFVDEVRGRVRRIGGG